MPEEACGAKEPRVPWERSWKHVVIPVKAKIRAHLGRGVSDAGMTTL